MSVSQPCPTLCDPVDCCPPSSSVHGILQARILEWVAISFSKGSSRPRDQTQVSNIAGRRFNLCTTKKALKYKNTVSGGQWFTPSLPHTHHSCQVSLCVPSSGPDPMGTSPHISGKVSVKVFHTEGKPCPQSSPLTGKG